MKLKLKTTSRNSIQVTAHEEDAESRRLTAKTSSHSDGQVTTYEVSRTLTMKRKWTPHNNDQVIPLEAELESREAISSDIDQKIGMKTPQTRKKDLENFFGLGSESPASSLYSNTAALQRLFQWRTRCAPFGQ